MNDFDEKLHGLVSFAVFARNIANYGNEPMEKFDFDPYWSPKNCWS